MQDMDIPIMDLVEEFEIQFKRKPNSMEELKQFYKDRYEYKGPGDVKMKEEIKEKVVMEAKDGGRINFDEGGISLDEQQMEIIKGGGPKIVGLLANADKMMGTEGDRLDMALKMLLRDNEDNELLKYMLDTAEERGTTKLDVLMDLIRSQRISDISAFDRGKKSLKDDISVKDLARKEGSMKDGGRIGFSEGSNGKSMNEIRVDEMMTIAKDIRENNDVSYGEASDLADIIDYYKYGKGQSETYTGNNPIIKFHLNMKADGGLMNLGGKEMDLRKGGFVPIGKKEKADDVPARLSKNEFVMTADAVRAAGGGSVNKGAKRMYNLMNTLEAKA